jgi:hypothetical protein
MRGPRPLCASTLLAAVLMLASPSNARAQSGLDRATVIQNAPIMLLPDAARVPLRVAAKGTSLVILTDEGDWLQVQFQDPQYGPRIGYIQKRFVNIRAAALEPQDLSVPTTPAAPAVASASAVPQAGTSQVQNPQPLAGSPTRTIPQRSGFWFNAGLGVGSLGCDYCDGFRVDGLSGGLSLGGTLSDRWLLGFGTTGWARDTVLGTLSVGTADARVRFYPSLYSGFFITGGLGLGSVSLGNFSETGAGAVFGVGWDIRVSRNVSLTPFYNGFAMRSTIADANVGQIGLGVTIH